jgi:hypothetical protein
MTDLPITNSTAGSVKNMFTSIVSVVQKIFTSRILWLLIGVFLILSLIVGGIIYWGMFFYLLMFGIASIWIPRLRGIFSNVLVAGALLFFANGLLLQPINGALSEKFPSYESYVGNSIANMDLWFAEGTIMRDKDAMFSEAITGTLGTITKSSTVYTADGKFQSPRVTRGKETRIKLLGVLREGPGKGLAEVMFLNSAGDFFNGPKGYVPIKKIELDNPTEMEDKKTNGEAWPNIGQKSGVDELTLEHSRAALTEAAKMKAAGWRSAKVAILRGPEGEPVVKVRLPGAEGKKVQFKKYRWTKSYIKESGGSPKILSTYHQAQDETLMGKSPVALMSGPNPPPDIIWWETID